MSSVLHHLIAGTRAKSLILVENLLLMLTDFWLASNGFLIVDEGYYLSYLFPSISSHMIFYGLKLLNFLRIDISFLFDEFQPGLEVNFLTKCELDNMLRILGNTQILSDSRASNINTIYKICFVKEIGHLSYMISKFQKKKM